MEKQGLLLFCKITAYEILKGKRVRDDTPHIELVRELFAKIRRCFLASSSVFVIAASTAKKAAPEAELYSFDVEHAS